MWFALSLCSRVGTYFGHLKRVLVICLLAFCAVNPWNSCDDWVWRPEIIKTLYADFRISTFFLHWFALRPAKFYKLNSGNTFCMFFSCRLSNSFFDHKFTLIDPKIYPYWSIIDLHRSIFQFHRSNLYLNDRKIFPYRSLFLDMNILFPCLLCVIFQCIEMFSGYITLLEDSDQVSTKNKSSSILLLC